MQLSTQLHHAFLAVLLCVYFVKSQGSTLQGKPQFTCIPIPAPVLSGTDFQVMRVECGARIPRGKASTATFDWQEFLSDDAVLEQTTLLASPINGTIGGQGEERISVHTTFLRDDLPVPTCQTKKRLLLTFNRTVTINVETKLGRPADSDVGDGGESDMEADPDAPRWDDYGPRPRELPVEDDDEGQDQEEEVEEEEEDRGRHGNQGRGRNQGKRRGHNHDADEGAGRVRYRAKSQGTNIPSSGPEAATASTAADDQFNEWEDTEEEVDVELASWGDSGKECPHKVPKTSRSSRAHSSRGSTGRSHRNHHGDYKHQESAEVRTSALPSQVASRKTATPGGLRVKVKCKSAALDAPALSDTCSVHLRLRLQFNGGLQAIAATNRPQRAAQTLVNDNGYTCAPRTFLDVLNVLDTEQLNGNSGDAVQTQVCYPPAPAGAGRRRLAQAEASAAEPAQTGNPTIPAGAVWDDVTQTRAVRAARYCSAILGCIPGLTTPNGVTRTWAAVAAWGGPAGSPLNKQCRSCFKDGVSYDLGGPPVGWETPDFSVTTPNSYRDAVIVLTDTLMVPRTPSIIVLFRATSNYVTNGLQWLSNIGVCMLAASIQTPVNTTNAAAGSVCTGWKSPITALNRGNDGDTFGWSTGTQNGPTDRGLLQEVKDRIAALRPDPTSNDTPTRIFVIGHSRGAALATEFAAELLVEQQAGGLYNYVGPNGRRAQVSLYTVGGPRVGNPAFAQYLEERMFERFRIINRYDPVPFGPFERQGYAHYRPSVWFRDGSGNILPSPRSFCVLTPQAQLTPALQQCFISCNNALVCAYNAAVPAAAAAAGVRVPASSACESITESLLQPLPGIPSLPQDHVTYMGIDVGNGGTDGCRFDVSVYAEACPVCRASNRGAGCPAVQPA